MGLDKLDIARGQRICRLMDSTGIGNLDLAAMAGISSASVTQWRKGHEIKCKYLPILAKGLNTTIDFILTGESEPSPGEIQTIIKIRRLNLHIREAIIVLIDKLVIDE